MKDLPTTAVRQSRNGSRLAKRPETVMNSEEMAVTRRAALGGLTALGIVGMSGAAMARSTVINLDPNRGDVHYRLVMAPTEHRGLHLRMRGGRAIHAFQVGALPPELTCEAYRAEPIQRPNGREAPDPLVPIGPHFADGLFSSDLYCRFYVDRNASEGEYRISLLVDDESGGRVEINLDVRIVPIDLPNLDRLTIQATLWGPGDPKFNEHYDPVRFMTTMRQVDVNAIALTRGHKPLPHLVHLALDEMGFRSVRLPEHKMFSRRDKPTKEEMAEHFIALEQNLVKLERILDRPEWQGRLTYKLWDEPTPDDYAQVVNIYRHARAQRPGLRLEISEEPNDQLGDIADIWTIHANWLDVSPIEQRKARGNDVWFYANKLHALNRPENTMRMIGWLLWRYRLMGYHFWSMNWWRVDPWERDSEVKEAIYKDGTFLFPSRDRPGDVLTSLRLQSFRDGLQDWRWLQWLDERAAQNGSDSAEARLSNRLRETVNWTAAFEQRLDVEQLHKELQTTLLAGSG